MRALPPYSNAVYFRWLEVRVFYSFSPQIACLTLFLLWLSQSGRLALMRELAWGLPEDLARDFGGSGKRKGVILARITFDYKVSHFYPDFNGSLGGPSWQRSYTTDGLLRAAAPGLLPRPGACHASPAELLKQENDP